MGSCCDNQSAEPQRQRPPPQLDGNHAAELCPQCKMRIFYDPYISNNNQSQCSYCFKQGQRLHTCHTCRKYACLYCINQQPVQNQPNQYPQLQPQPAPQYRQPGQFVQQQYQPQQQMNGPVRFYCPQCRKELIRDPNIASSNNFIECNNCNAHTLDVWSCEPCDYDVCTPCCNSMSQQRPSPPQYQPQQQMNVPVQFYCPQCRKELIRDPNIACSNNFIECNNCNASTLDVWSCAPCDYDICTPCCNSLSQRR